MVISARGRLIVPLIVFVSLLVGATVARAALQADFSCSPSCQVNAGTTVTFTSTSTSSSEFGPYEWDLDGDGLYGTDDEPDDPAGPRLTSVQRTFPDPGTYMVGLRVTNRGGETDTVVKDVTVTPAEEPEPPPADPEPPTEVLAETGIEMIQTAKPRSLGAQRLNRLARRRDPRPIDDGESQFIPMTPLPPDEPCVDCEFGLAAPGIPNPLTPPLVGKPFTGFHAYVDPQVAASNTHLVIGMRDWVWFYDKSGQLLKSNVEQKSSVGPILKKDVPYKLHLCDFFEPIIPAMNEAIDATLPHDQVDVDGNSLSVANGYGINCNAKTGGVQPGTNGKPGAWSAPPEDDDEDTPHCPFYRPDKMFFDARVIWDEYNQRFWIAALAPNGQAKYRYTCGCPSDQSEDGCWYTDDTNLGDTARAKRSLLALAVSKTHDPRDGWNQAWAWAYPGQDSCPANQCPYSGGLDYLSAGITSKYLSLEYLVGDTRRQGVADLYRPAITAGEERRQLTAVATKPLVNGTGMILYQNSEPIIAGSDSLIGRDTRIQPAMQHPPDGIGRNLYFVGHPNGHIGSDPKSAINIWRWQLPSQPGGPPSEAQILKTVVPVTPHSAPGPFGSPVTPQHDGGNLALAYYVPTAFSTIGTDYYVAFDECLPGCQGTGIRSILIKGGGPLVSELTIQDPDSWLSFPGMAVNKHGDRVFVYQSSGAKTTNPEARYSVLFHDEPGPRPSGLLQAAKGPLNAGDRDHHYVGTSVDPFDETGVWMITGYANHNKANTKKFWSYAIGKVLGKAAPNLTFQDLIGKPAKFVGTGGSNAAKSKYKVKLAVANQGDGSAKKTKAAVFLLKKGAGGGAKDAARRRVVLKRFNVPKLRPGKSKRIKLNVKVPSRLRGSGRLLVKLDTKRRIKEYGEGDNGLRIPLPRQRTKGAFA